jgi:hypothetical protein
MDGFLLRAIRIVIRADSDPVRQALFANLKQSSLPVRFVYGLHERLGSTPLSGLLVSLYGLAFFLLIAPPRNRDARVLTVARHANARRQITRVASWIGAGECGAVDVRAGALLGRYAVPARPLHRAAQALRIVRAIDRRHGFLVSCRASSALAWYARGKAMLMARRAAAVLVSSDSNPEEVGFTAAARAVGVPTIFISHAYPTPFSPPADFSLSILEGQAEVRARSRNGAIKGDVVLAGVEGESAAIDPQRMTRTAPVIGIFTPKAISWPRLAALVADCREHFRATEIVIRWHPSMLERPRLGDVIADLSGIVETSRSQTLTEVARRCDWVIADENSGVHLPVLKLGIPTVPIRQLGLYSRSDMYGFIANHIVFPPVASIREVNVADLVAFFGDSWSARFQEYDASYLRPPHLIGVDVRRAIGSLFAAPSKATCA